MDNTLDTVARYDKIKVVINIINTYEKQNQFQVQDSIQGSLPEVQRNFITKKRRTEAPKQSQVYGAVSFSKKERSKIKGRS